jgi:hypothetical protein
MVTGWAAVAIAAMFLGGVGLLVAAVTMSLWPQKIPRGCSVAEIRARVLDESKAMQSWHSAPRRALGEIEAYRTLSRHRHCVPGDGATPAQCGRKAAALQIVDIDPELVSAGPHSGIIPIRDSSA